MLKKSLNTLLFASVFVMVALFTVNSGLAQEECEAPDVIYLKVKGTPTPEDYDWKVSVSTEKIVINDLEYINYTYAAINSDNDNNGLDYITVSVPDCCPDEKDIEIVPAYPKKTSIFEVGVGEPTMNVGRGDYQSFLIKWTPSQINAPVFAVDTKNSGKVSVNLKVGSKLLGGIIRGPACRGFAQPAVTVEEKIITEDGEAEFCIVKDPSTQCAKEITDCKGNPLPSVPIEDIFFDKTDEYNLQPITEILDPSGHGCQVFTLKSGHNSCYYAVFGGRAYRFCY